MNILGLDVSHFQGGVNFAQVKASGRDFVVIKATDGIGYTDPLFTANRKAAHAAGLIVGLYHFARAGDPAAEAAYFLRTIGAVQPGEFLVLDWEVPAGNPPAWCQQWLDAVRAATGVAPLIYMNQSAVNGSNWSNVAKTYGLWLARYDNAPAAQNAVPYWGVPAMKQYSDAGTVLGVSSPCDVDVFFGTADQLRAYGASNGAADMPLSDADLAAVENHAYIAVRNLLADMAGGNAAQSVSALGTVLAATPLGTQVGDLHGKVVDSVFDLTGRPGPDKDDLLGQVLSLRAELRKAQAPTVDPKALAAALVADAQAVGSLADALAAAIAKRLGNG